MDKDINKKCKCENCGNQFESKTVEVGTQSFCPICPSKGSGVRSVCTKWVEDTNTLREEWDKKFKNTDMKIFDSVVEDFMPDHIADWWLNKFNQKLEEIEEEIEKEKEDIENIIEPCKDSAEYKNKVLDLVLQIIKNKKN